MTNVRHLSKRSAYIIGAVLVALASIIPILVSTKANAALVTSRSITMDTSAPSTSGSYTVSFVSQSSYTVKGIVIDFCDNSPIINDTTCTATVGTNVPTLATTTITPTSGITGTWTPTLAFGGRTLEITNATGNAQTAGSTTVTFSFNAVTNPSNLGTFYARIYTYSTTAGATGYTVANPATGGAVTDSGGVSLSTANQITITAKVQEEIVFCVFASGSNCAGGSGTALTLGDANGVLSSTTAYTNNNAFYGISTNALNNASVVMKSSDQSLKSGANTIDNITTLSASAVGTEQFGVCFYQSSGSGLTVNPTYTSGSACSTGATTGAYSGSATFIFPTIASSTGSTVADKPAGAESDVKMNFLGNISSTTQAGVYADTLTFIATGTY